VRGVRAQPHLRPLVTSLAAAMEDASAVVFLGFSALYHGVDAPLVHPPVPLEHIALGWAALCSALALATWAALPPRAAVQQQPSAADGKSDDG